MSNKIIVLGGGMVGSAIARDLQEDKHLVTIADRDEGIQDQQARYGIDYIKLDFSELHAVAESVNNFDLVVGAVPGFMGFEILKTVLKSKKILLIFHSCMKIQENYTILLQTMESLL